MTTRRPGLSGRLVVTVALLYAIFFAPNVVRETYLAVAIAEQASIRVDRFVGLHPDIFEIPGRGAYINSNPGASMLGAIPYAIVLPAFELLYRLKPALVAPKPSTAYADPRPNRATFMNEMRARGLDVRLELAAAAMHVGLDVPLGVLAALALFVFLRQRLRDERKALWLALLFAFGTPVFFRSAFLNQNLVLADCTLFAFLALAWRVGDGQLPQSDRRRLFAAGALLGVGLLCDYSAAPLLIVFELWVAVLAARDGGWPAGIRAGALFAAGAAGPVAVLLAYQHSAFGNALLPAQAYMAHTALSEVGWYGLRLPSSDLLWRNMLDPGYGLLMFCPMLAGAAWAAKYRRGSGGVGVEELTLIYSASFALYLFSSSVSYAALQWNTGVRYLVPAVPLLFVALVPVLINAPRAVRWVLVIPSVIVSLCVSMARESVPVSLKLIVTTGLQLPWHTVLRKTTPAYVPRLAGAWTPIVVALLAGTALWLVWRSTEFRPVLD